MPALPWPPSRQAVQSNWANRPHSTPRTTAWEDFAQQQGGTLPDALAIAVAGPVGGEVIRFTNNPWIIRPALIPEKLGAARYSVVNDFGAVGHAVACGDSSVGGGTSSASAGAGASSSGRS